MSPDESRRQRGAAEPARPSTSTPAGLAAQPGWPALGVSHAIGGLDDL